MSKPHDPAHVQWVETELAHYKEALRELLDYVEHDSWRCSRYQECHCGLNDLMTKYGLKPVPFHEK